LVEDWEGDLLADSPHSPCSISLKVDHGVVCVDGDKAAEDSKSDDGSMIRKENIKPIVIKRYTYMCLIITPIIRHKVFGRLCRRRRSGLRWWSHLDRSMRP
jgi:hypothetical protein